MSGGVLIASHDPIARKLAASLADQGVRAAIVSTRAEAEDALADASTTWVAILDADLPAYAGAQLCALLQAERGIPMLLLFPAALGYQFPYAESGASREFALKPLSVGELVLRVEAMMLRAGIGASEVPAPRSAVNDPPLKLIQSGHAHKIVAVFSLKGGSGKSTIAVNTSVGLAQRGQKVALIDADLWTGDVAVLMNVSGRFSVADVCWRQMTELESLQQIMERHPSGVDVLQRPLEITVNEELRTEPLVEALPIYRSAYDFVVVNMSSSLDELNLQILDTADVILLVTTPEIAAITNTTRFLDVAKRVGYDQRIMLLLNRANSGINVQTIEDTLHRKVAACLVSDGRAVVEAANDGVPLVIRDHQARRPLTQGFLRLAERLAGDAGVRASGAPRSRNVLSFIRRLAG